jgi:hypothetical protein
MSEQKPVDDHPLGLGLGELASGLLKDGKQVRFRASGISMGPAVKNGDVLTIRPVSGDSLTCGDIVLCQCTDSRLVAHRIIDTRRSGDVREFLVKGDRTWSVDGWVTEAQVLGQVVELWRGGARIDLEGSGRRFVGCLLATASRFNLWQRRPADWARRLRGRLGQKSWAGDGGR